MKNPTLIGLIAILLHFASPITAEETLVLQQVDVVDVEAGALRRNLTVTVRDGTIASIQPATRAEPPRGAKVIDGEGTFLMPGLWDMHTHWYEPDVMALFPLNGVTGIRQMAYTAAVPNLRKKVGAGKRLGPRMVFASTIVDGPQPVWPGSIAMTGPEQATAVLDRAQQQQADFVKVYALLGRDSFLALLAGARARELPVAGHIPIAVSVTEAVEAGMASIEHLDGLVTASSAFADDFRREIDTHIAAQGTDAALLDLHVSQRARALEATDPLRTQKLAALLAHHRTWQCPTLVVWHNYARMRTMPDDPRLRFIPRNWRNNWNDTREQVSKTWDDEAWARARALHQRQMSLLGTLAGAGVPILAGTDVQVAYSMPGFSLHDELALMVEAGLSPSEALRTATSNPAAFLGLEDTRGSVDVGKIADLVLLRANPLDDIEATTTIEAVVLGGKLLDRNALDRLFTKLERRSR